MSEKPTITIHAALRGFPIDIAFAGSIEQLTDAVARLQRLGATPPPRATFGGGKPMQRPLTQPLIEDDGTACCPDHTLRNGRHMPIAWRAGKDGRAGFWGCNAKAQGVAGEKINERGYCEHRFDWPAPKE